MRKKIIVLHHLASTGGTIITRALSTMHNVKVINEIHPFHSQIRQDGVSPTTAVDQYVDRYLDQKNGQYARMNFFVEQIDFIYNKLLESKDTLLIRDWSHGDFIIHKIFDGSINKTLPIGKYQSVVTVRHPLYTFLSSRKSGFLGPIRGNVIEFMKRYELFLNCYRGWNIFKYEDFSKNSHAWLENFCQMYEIDFNPDFNKSLDTYKFSGFVPRESVKITGSQTKEIPEDIAKALGDFDLYGRLCERLGYSTLI